MLRILIGCEFSGTVRRAFRHRGHDAWSCDLLPAEDKSKYHIQGNVLDYLEDNWDLAIFHPPCTYLCGSGIHWNNRGRGWKKTEEALNFVQQLLGAPISKIALENPIGIISSRIRKPDQIIQPWQFGHDASKSTALWLKNLPPLLLTKIVSPKHYQQVKFAGDMPDCDSCGDKYCEDCDEHYADCFCIGPTEDEVNYKEIKGIMFGTRENPLPRPIWGNQTPSGQNKLGPSPDRWKLRSLTYQGIADAFAEQWG